MLYWQQLKSPYYDLQAALVTTEMDRVNFCVRMCVYVCVCVFARVCANECVMGLFDWWHCYCQSIHHSSSPVLPPCLSPSLFHPSRSHPPLMVLYFPPFVFFRSPLDSRCSLFVTFIHCSCPSLTVFPYLGSPLVSLSVKLWVQADQWVQDGGVWPREPDGGRDGGEFSHVSANAHTNVSTTPTLRRRNCYASGLIRPDWCFPVIADVHLDLHSTQSDSQG